MALTDVWFLLIAVLWIGYFFLEGFDFGVGMLGPVLGRTEAEKRVLINTIGPVWDGNEVWLLVAGGATFAAFPEWYATLFSGFYLPLLIILVALIIRGVAFEYRGKIDSPVWRTRWDWALTIGSFLPALLWGVAFANIVHGVPIDANHEYTGGFFTLLNPYALLGGLTTLSLFLFHGALYLALKTDGEVRARANTLAGWLGLAAVVIGASFLLWTQLDHGKGSTWVTTAIAALALVAGLVANRLRQERAAFFLSGAAVAVAVATLFVGLYPNVMPSTTDAAFNLTATNAASGHYTLTVMTWVALIFTPLVLLYQGWSYWVFRKRVSSTAIPPVIVPNPDGSGWPTQPAPARR